MTTKGEKSKPDRQRIERDAVTIRFAGDSGDGMQLIGSQFTGASALLGNDISVMPDYPAEIRAPAATTYGISGYQIQFSSFDIHTPGDRVDALVAMNPAALKVNLSDLAPGGIILINEDGVTDHTLKLAGYVTNPLEDGTLAQFQVFRVPITKATTAAVEALGLSAKEAQRCKNFYALGVVMWLFNRKLDPVIDFLNRRFAGNPQFRDANQKALRAGWYFGETAEIFTSNYHVPHASLPPGTYRRLSGNQGLALGLITASAKSGKPLFYASYPITPASDILHELARHKNFGVRTFQAEDEIAAICACIGSAYGGGLAATGTSGPGMALKAEALNLAVMTELPLVAINVQRGGPSTGLPTKTEQADLLQALFGRNSESPVPVIAAQSPGDCFQAAFEACKVALKHMTPVILLTDAYLANGAEPWLVPDADAIESIEVEHPESWEGPFTPYVRDERGVRPWALPGTPDLQHRIGGLEKKDVTGEVSYDPDNHDRMVRLREEKVAKIADTLPLAQVHGNQSGGDLLVVTWGSAFGSAFAAVNRARKKRLDVSHLHLRWLNPLPKNVGEILKQFDRILVPELNRGQLTHLLRARYLVDAQCFPKVKGRPFMVSEIEERIEECLGLRSHAPASAQAQ